MIKADRYLFFVQKEEEVAQHARFSRKKDLRLFTILMEVILRGVNMRNKDVSHLDLFIGQKKSNNSEGV